MPKEPLPAIAGGFHSDPSKMDPRVSRALGELLIGVLQPDSQQKLSYVIASVGLAGFVSIVAREVGARVVWSTLIDAAYRAVENDAGGWRESGSHLVQAALALPKEVAP